MMPITVLKEWQGGKALIYKLRNDNKAYLYWANCQTERACKIFPWENNPMSQDIGSTRPVRIRWGYLIAEIYYLPSPL